LVEEHGKLVKAKK